MYELSEKQIDFILNDIKLRGVEMEDLQLNLLDHICCIIECELDQDGDFENFYQKTIPKFFKNELKEIEQETILLLTYKNYYAMKKTIIISGVLSVILLITGSFFKAMHWPGAGPLLVFGIVTVSFVFLPFMFLLKSKDFGTKRDKLLVAIGSLTGIFLCLSTLFSIMHWPGGIMLWLTTITLSGLVFIPIYFFTGINKPEKNINTIVTTVLLVTATSLVFMMINMRPALKQTQIKMYTYIQGEELLKRVQRTQRIENKLTTEINLTAEKIKKMIIEDNFGGHPIPTDIKIKDLEMEEKSLGIEFYDDQVGVQLLKVLKTSVVAYNTEMAAEENKIPIDKSILDIEFDKIGRYTNYSVLNSITQIQMYLATTKNNVTASK